MKHCQLIFYKQDSLTLFWHSRFLEANLNPKTEARPIPKTQHSKIKTQKPGPITNLTRNLAHKSRFVRSIAVPRAPSVTTFWVDWNTHTHFLVIWKVNPRTTWGIANGLKRFWGWRNIVPRGEKNVCLLNWIYILCQK